MKLPRDIDAKDLIKLLKPFGYLPTRQTGSHIRLTTEMNGQHHITVPNHKPLKAGTLSAIIADIAAHLQISKEEFIKILFT